MNHAFGATAAVFAYGEHGLGYNIIELRTTGEPVGIAELLQRETLEAVDLGYALVARHAGQGLASEAARAVLAHARGDLGLTPVLAIIAMQAIPISNWPHR